MGFSRQEYWNGLPYPPPGDLPDPGIEKASLMSPALAGDVFTTSATWEVYKIPIHHIDMCCFLSGHSLSFGNDTPKSLVESSLPARGQSGRHVTLSRHLVTQARSMDTSSLDSPRLMSVGNMTLKQLHLMVSISCWPLILHCGPL